MSHKLSAEYKEQITEFYQFVINARKLENFELAQMGNITFNVPSNKTVYSKKQCYCFKMLKLQGTETHYMVVLSCCADVNKLQPPLFCKRKMLLKEKLSKGMFVHVCAKGWVDEGGIKLWI